MHSSSTSESQLAIGRILDSLDALVYVADMQTHELLFMNAYGRNKWGEAKGRKCWQVLQAEQEGPCQFCTNKHLLNQQGEPAEVYVWEFQNTSNGRWYQCRDQAIEWSDGRWVRIEIATDITERKNMEQALIAARQEAELLADTDMLTSLNNRRAFFNLGKQALHLAERNATPLSLVMFDLDHFKHINDQYGHAAGDQVLQQIAATATKQVRASDILARLGGEEFALLMPQTRLDQACLLAERLRQRFEQLTLTFQGHSLYCTASFGVSCTSKGDTNLDTLLAQADRALYDAKHSGRNQVSSLTSATS